MMDLLGSEYPVAPPSCESHTIDEESKTTTTVEEDDDEIQFRWGDGVLLQAIKEGHWLLIDEMNLA